MPDSIRIELCYPALYCCAGQCIRHISTEIIFLRERSGWEWLGVVGSGWEAMPCMAEGMGWIR